MKEYIMKPRHSRGLQDSEKRAVNQTKATLCASPTPRTKPFTGKVFYLDLTSNKVAETLESDIISLGGTVEKFFSKEIKYLVSNKREAKYVQCLRQDSPVPSPESRPSSPQLCSNPHQPQSHGDSAKSTSQLHKDTVAVSRGKSLVKRVVKEQERIQMNKILSNALEWGVKILYLDDVMSYIQKKKKGISCQQPAPAVVKTNIKKESTKLGFQKSKAGRIGKPFVKVEDSSRHYRPFYLRLTNVPEFNLSTRPPCTPFCLDDRQASGNKAHCQRGARASASDERPNERKKKKQGGYCECCLVKYENITTHLRSDRHQTFAKSDAYLVVDKLMSAMPCSFTHIRSRLKRPKSSVSSVLIVPRPFVDPKPRAADGVDFDLAHSPFNGEKRDGPRSAPASKPSASPVVHRINKRRKRCTLSDSKHKPKQPCGQYQTSAIEEEGPHRLVAPPTGDGAAAHPALSDAQLSDTHSPETPAAVNVHSEPSPETLHETNPESPTKQQTSPCATAHRESPTKQQTSPCATAYRDILLHKQSTENSVSLKEALPEDFFPVERIKRKVKVYKWKRRKKFTPLVSSDSVKQSDAAGDGLMRLWEMFQDSDDMDVEFYGFE